ncbi:MAG: DUF3817 domain-containing protein [Bacteroidetes bacterium]|nr:DUF3817 domain-containing protein [Bacteroidota bacterium]
MDSDKNKSISSTIKIAHYEGISFLVLLLVAMPLKYMFQYPIAVTIVGSIHGILFITYLWKLYFMLDKKIWTFKKCAIAGLLGIVPAGTFFLK